MAAVSTKYFMLRIGRDFDKKGRGTAYFAKGRCTVYFDLHLSPFMT